MRLVPALCVALLFTLACGPLGPLAGRRLGGPVHQGGAPDWNAVADVETIQIETRPDDPYSVNVWCAVTDEKLYIPSSLILGPDDPNERTWVQNIEADPDVRVRIDGTVYELLGVRVEDPAEIETAREALLAKYSEEATDHSGKAWIYRMEPRP